MMRDAIDRFEESEELVELTIFYGLLADRYLLHDEFSEANRWVDKGLQLVETYGECFVEAPLLRLKARCLQHTQNSFASDLDFNTEIDRLYQQANAVAESQQAVIWQANQTSSQNNNSYNIEDRFP